MPSGPSATRSTSGASGSIVMTTSLARATSAGVAAACAPAATSVCTAAGCDVEHRQRVALLEHVARHRRAHRAESDEADVWSRCFTAHVRSFQLRDDPTRARRAGPCASVRA